MGTGVPVRLNALIAKLELAGNLLDDRFRELGARPPTHPRRRGPDMNRLDEAALRKERPGDRRRQFGYEREQREDQYHDDAERQGDEEEKQGLQKARPCEILKIIEQAQRERASRRTPEPVAAHNPLAPVRAAGVADGRKHSTPTRPRGRRRVPFH